jgi:hypothetical protein
MVTPTQRTLSGVIPMSILARFSIDDIPVHIVNNITEHDSVERKDYLYMLSLGNNVIIEHCGEIDCNTCFFDDYCYGERRKLDQQVINLLLKYPEFAKLRDKYPEYFL